MIDIMYYLTSQEFLEICVSAFACIVGLVAFLSLLFYSGSGPSVMELKEEIERLEKAKNRLNMDQVQNIYLHEARAGRVVITDGDMSKICKKEIDGEWYCTRTGRKCSPNIYCTFCNFVGDPNKVIDKAYENFTEEMKRKYL